MADRYFNPFQAIDINVPVELHEAFTRYCQTGGNAVIDQSPFPRMVDLWFLAVCVAARLDLEPVDVTKYETRKIIDANPFMTEMLGYTRDQLIGRELYEIGLLRDEAASQAMVRRLHASNQARYEHLPLESRGGGHHEVEVVANLYDENGLPR